MPPVNRSDVPHSNLPNVDPLSQLYSLDSEGLVDTIRFNDEGSRAQYVYVEIQGVPASGIINSKNVKAL